MFGRFPEGVAPEVNWQTGLLKFETVAEEEKLVTDCSTAQFCCVQWDFKANQQVISDWGLGFFDVTFRLCIVNSI